MTRFAKFLFIMEASEPGRLGFSLGAGADCFVNEFHESGAVDEFDGMLGDEFLSGQ